MDEELRTIRAQEALADEVYESFYSDEKDSSDQQAADDRNSLLGSSL